MADPAPPVAFAPHDHAACVKAALEAAHERCAQRRLRLTPVREAALKILLESHRALGAYDLLDRLRDAGFGGQPPVAYRALEFLTAHGFAHRIEKLNAYIACAHPDHVHNPAFLICRACGKIGEAEAPPDAVADAAAQSGFAVERAVIEAEGLCPACAAREG